MKKLVFILALIILGTHANSQTKEDILDWIVSQVNTHPVKTPNFYYEYEFSVSGDNTLVLKSSLLYFDTKNPYHNTSYETDYLDISDISNIIFKYNETNTWMIIYTKSKHKKSNKSKNIPDQISYSNEANIILDTSINKDNLPKRLKKAWADYVRLHGGQIKKDIY
jgi:hypothetical protein